jgi:hypothetical protein
VQRGPVLVLEERRGATSPDLDDGGGEGSVRFLGELGTDWTVHQPRESGHAILVEQSQLEVIVAEAR